MSDRLDNHGEADDILDAFLLAHVGELRNTIGHALNVQAGLANLQALRRKDDAHVYQVRPVVMSSVEVKESGEPGGVAEGHAVRELLTTLMKEQRQVRAFRERIEALEVRQEVGKLRLRRVVRQLRFYSSYLGTVTADFMNPVSVDKDRVLTQFRAQERGLKIIRRQLEALVADTEGRQQRKWKLLVLLMEEREEALLELYTTIQRIFDNSDFLQEVSP
ncbi:hypothetical protein ACFU9B_42285 [Streptomyces sp. NPDC057592]|uniref:hypothetical protein n=1 Tax=unclassified Streptomyces TaxID=2593676 RepID=UPI0036B84F88